MVWILLRKSDGTAETTSINSPPPSFESSPVFTVLRGGVAYTRRALGSMDFFEVSPGFSLDAPPSAPAAVTVTGADGVSFRAPLPLTVKP